jgi:hypothetical protein
MGTLAYTDTHWQGDLTSDRLAAGTCRGACEDGMDNGRPFVPGLRRVPHGTGEEARGRPSLSLPSGSFAQLCLRTPQPRVRFSSNHRRPAAASPQPRAPKPPRHLCRRRPLEVRSQLPSTNPNRSGARGGRLIRALLLTRKEFDFRRGSAATGPGTATYWASLWQANGSKGRSSSLVVSTSSQAREV